MSTPLTDPLVLAGVVTGVAGGGLLLQARVQSRMLRHRMAVGAGTVVVDPATGLFSAAAAWHCVRAEANRAMRLARPLHVWVATADDAAQLDQQGRELRFAMPSGATGFRVDRRHLCLVSCADVGECPEQLATALSWRTRTIDPGDDAVQDAFLFLSEATRA